MGFPYDKNGYNISLKQIKTLAEKEKWVCEFDDISNNESLNIKEDIYLDTGIEINDKDNEIKDLKIQIEELKNKLLKSKVKKNKAIFIKAEIEQTDEELELELLELEILGK
jgi:SRSO17 transposase